MSEAGGKLAAVPSLRFPEFSGAWEEKRLAALVDHFQSGEGITSSEIVLEGAYPVFGGNGLRGYSDRFTHNGDFVLIGRQGALCGNINRATGRSFFSEHAIVVSANAENSIDWLEQKLDLLNLNRLSESSAQPGLSVKKLERLKLFTPTLPEQQKLASFLGAVDARAGLLRRRREALAAYKRAMMQRLFARGLRFTKPDGSPFPDWQEKRLGEVCSFIKDGTHGTHPDDPNGQHLLLSAKNIVDGRLAYDGEDRHISQTEFSQISRTFPLKTNDILLTIVGTIGRAAIFNGPDHVAFQRSVAFFRLKEMNVSFAYQYIIGEAFQRQLKRRQVVSAQPGIYLGDLAKIPLPYPHPEEQQKIADFLTALDAKIDAVNSQIAAIQRFKQGLLQQMFV